MLEVKLYDLGYVDEIEYSRVVCVSRYKDKWVFSKNIKRGGWEIPGGHIEEGESWQDACKRELYEETGLIAKELTLFGVFSGKELHNIYPNGDEVSNIDIVYICKSYDGELKCQPGEVENLKFFDVSDLPDNIFKPNIPAIEEYISKYTIR